jgi:hypothetical protein
VVICPCLALKEDDVGVDFPGAGWVFFALEIHFSRDFAGWGNARVVVWGDYLPTTTTTTTTNNNNINSNIQTMSC